MKKIIAILSLAVFLMTGFAFTNVTKVSAKQDVAAKDRKERREDRRAKKRERREERRAKRKERREGRKDRRKGGDE